MPIHNNGFRSGSLSGRHYCHHPLSRARAPVVVNGSISTSASPSSLKFATPTTGNDWVPFAHMHPRCAFCLWQTTMNVLIATVY